MQIQLAICCKYTVFQKTSHLWFAITLAHVNAFWYFGRLVIDKVSNQKMLYCATSNNLNFCTTWQNGETQKSHFFTQMLYQCIARIQPVAPWFLQSFWLATHTLLYDSLNLVINVFSSGLLGGGMVQEKGSWEHCSVCTVACTMHVHQCAVFLKKMSSVMCLIACNICWDSTISH